MQYKFNTRVGSMNSGVTKGEAENIVLIKWER
jgi:hypothetical protein